MWAKMESILNTHPVSVHTKLELDWIYTIQIMVGNHHQEGQNLANIAKKQINANQHSATSVEHKFELDCVNTFSDNGWKPPFSVICGN